MYDFFFIFLTFKLHNSAHGIKTRLFNVRFSKFTISRLMFILVGIKTFIFFLEMCQNFHNILNNQYKIFKLAYLKEL